MVPLRRPTRQKSILVRATFVASMFLYACTGAVGGGNGAGPDESGRGGSGTAGTDNGSVGGGTTNSGGTSAPIEVGPMPLIRLTRAEYTDTIRWLFGDPTLTPATAFSLEAGSESGFAKAQVTVGVKDARDFREAAEVIAAKASQPVAKFTGCDSTAPTDACLSTFVKKLGRRIYRRPLTATEVTEQLGLFNGARMAGNDVAGSVAVIVESMLQSPFFLFKWEMDEAKPKLVDGDIELNKYQLASRLAFLLSGRAPDDMLIADVDGGRFSSDDDLVRATQRLLAAKETAARVYTSFHRQWLELTRMSELRKDTTKYSYWDTAITADLQTEFDTFVTDVLLNGDGKLNTLLTAPYTYANERVAKIYGASGITGGSFQKLELDPAQRKGVLMQAAFMAATGDEANSLAPRRGTRILRRILCGEIPPPPMVVPDLPMPKTGQTNRQRFEDHGTLSCARSCHQLIDPPGFAFENFGGAGEYRTKDNGLPVDSSGRFTTPNGVEVSFDNGAQMVEKLAGLPEVGQCVAAHWLRYALGRAEVETEAGELTRISAKFSQSGGSLSALLQAITSGRSFRFRKPTAGEVL